MKKICVITGTRAEYGLLRPTLLKLNKDRAVALSIVATGMHLSPEFGLTYREIENDGLRIDERVEMLLSADTPSSVTKSMGLALIGFADTLARINPDLLIVLGDRFETFAAATAAMVASIPIAHIHGGELTEGAIDDAMRHAITKMSHLHFTTTEDYRQRVIQLGEQPERVFNVGAPGIENIVTIKTLDRQALERELGIKLRKATLLVTYHPVTVGRVDTEREIGALLKALDAFKEVGIIFTLPNADMGGRAIVKLINDYVGRNPGRAYAFTSLGALRYLSAMRLADAVIGNSSSGIIEAPSFGVPTVDIGSRQAGRIRAASVIDCPTESGAIGKAIAQALSSEHRALSRKVINPYGDGRASERIVKALRGFKSFAPLIYKKFYDMKIEVPR